MANIKFIIRDASSDALQAICVTCRFGRNDKLMYATPLKVAAMFWDASRQRIKATRYCPYRDRVNDALDGLSEALGAYVADVVRRGGALTKESLRECLDAHFGRGRRRADTFHAFFEDYIEQCRTRMNGRRGGQVVTYKTQREYVRTLEYIRDYERAAGTVLDFDDVTQDFLAAFVTFLQGRMLATNTIAHKVICVKAVMRAAMERDLTQNGRWRYYHNATEETDAVALSERELALLRDTDLSRDMRLRRVRDLFLAGCWTGLRFSDLTQLRRENISDGVITLRQSKTGNTVSIPVHPVFAEIWERYGGALPASISNQKFNAYIKEVCRMAGITETVLKSITRGGRRITTCHEKWQLVSSHTARRSFATNLYRSGFPAISIMKITGHRTEAAFLRYIKVSSQEHARMLAEHWGIRKGGGSI